MSAMLRNLSSAEIEREFPYTSRVILRTRWRTHEQLQVNQRLSELTDAYRQNHFNRISCYHFAKREHAAGFTEFIRQGRYRRLKADSHEGASQEEVALEWMRICDERQTILAWGREQGRLRDVVYAYRFHRKIGRHGGQAFDEAIKTVSQLDPSIADPMNYAGVLLEWAEREHRAWFWRCCRDHHSL